MASGNGTKSLLEIQQEQARQEDSHKQPSNNKVASQNLPLAQAAVWSGASSPAHWAQGGAWASSDPRKGKNPGFWEEPNSNKSNKKETRK